MYEQFFGFKEKPFNMTPDPKFLYLSPEHKEALARLVYGVTEKKGFVELTGEIGVGKTTLSRALLQRLNGEVKTAVITNTRLTITQLLRSILRSLNIETKARTKDSLLAELSDFLIEQLHRGGNVVLIIDEAQNLDSSLLEEIRMLSNLETNEAKLIQILLLGQPNLKDKLNESKLKQLKQRISIRYHLLSLNRQLTEEYINHRLKIAGYNSNPIFSSGAVSEIYKYSKGIPRTINIVCDNTLLTGYVKGVKQIDRNMIKETINELEDSR